jgi:hypothetical protein
LAASNVDARAAVSAHRTFCFFLVVDDGFADPVAMEAALFSAFSRANRSLNDWYWLFTSSMNRGVEPEVVVSGVSPDSFFVMAIEGRLRFEPRMLLEALDAADDIVIYLTLLYSQI